MRIAVALPSLELVAPHRVSIDAMLARVVEDGHDVEGFAEHGRTDETDPFPVFHYLRMLERHRESPFDAALYPIGRDASPYQGVFFLMHRFPGMVWFLDPIVHHLAVGGIALMDDWVSYRKLLDEAYGARGAALAQTVASNWGTGAVFRRYDLAAAVASSQRRAVAAWRALAQRISERLGGEPVGVVPLGLTSEAARRGRTDREEGADRRERADRGPHVTPAEGLRRGALRVAIMTVNESYATTAVRAAAAALELAPEVGVSLCMAEAIYRAEGLRVASQLGIERRVDWVLTGAPEHLAQVVADSDVLVWLAEELQGGHRLLLLRGMAEGRLTFVPRCSLYDDLPDGAVVKLDLGHTLAPSFTALLGAAMEDRELGNSLARNARAFARGCAGAGEAAGILVAELRESARSGPLQMNPVSRPVWETVAAEMIDAAVPGGASPAVRQRITDVLRAHTEPFRE